MVSTGLIYKVYIINKPLSTCVGELILIESDFSLIEGQHLLVYDGLLLGVLGVFVDDLLLDLRVRIDQERDVDVLLDALLPALVLRTHVLFGHAYIDLAL